MKKTIFFVLVIMLSLSATVSAAVKSPEKNAIPSKTENKLSEEEISRLNKRVEEIRDMDKTKLSAKEKRDLRKELKEMKEDLRRAGGYVYIGAGTLILIIILVILLV